MKRNYLTALIVTSAITLTLTGCINQTSPKLAYLQAVSSLDSANAYEKSSTTDLDISVEGTISEEKRTFLNWVNQGTFQSNSVHDSETGLIDSTLSMKSNVGALPTRLNLPITVDESAQKVYIRLNSLAHALSDVVPVPENLHEKTLVIPLTGKTKGISTDNVEALLYTEMVSFVKALPEANFARVDRTSDEKQAKIKDKVSLSLTDTEIKEFIQEALTKSDLPSESKTAIQKLLSTLKVDAFTLTASMDKSGSLVGETSDIRILQTAAPVPNAWSFQNTSTYTHLESAPPSPIQPNLNDTLSLPDLLQLIASVQHKPSESDEDPSK